MLNQGEAMNASVKSIVTAAALAVAGLVTAGAASAHEYAPVQSWQRLYAYGPAPRYDGGDWRDACRAPRWDPNARYMPGDTVRRHGELYTARGISAHVWNVNSPPEWTPKYWVPARCR
jgi:hypothetical protein